MKLIGMLDSPYVRRVAVSFGLLGLRFEHQALSVFRDYDAFAAINPVVKAPTLVLDDGTVLIDSELILAHAERLAGTSLAPETIRDHAAAQRTIGLALAVCEKAVQRVYEHNLRPEEKRHQPWLDRVEQQLAAALALLDAAVATRGDWLFGDRPLQADVTAAVAWRFARETGAPGADPTVQPALAALSDRAEALDAFRDAPFG